jgi:hypothetical protein
VTAILSDTQIQMCKADDRNTTNIVHPNLLKTDAELAAADDAAVAAKSAQAKADAEFTAKYAALNASIAADDKMCLECGSVYARRSACPCCGSTEYSSPR